MNPHATRYNRHLALPNFSEQEQQKMAKAKVLLVGCGGLAHPALQYLTGAGIGCIGIVDSDRIEIHNLHRQILFTEEDIGGDKVKVVVERLKKLNSQVHFEMLNCLLESSNALAIIGNYDFVIDCTDNFASRYLIDDACAILKKKWIYAALYQYEGHISVFDPGHGYSYRSIYRSPPKSGSIPDCESGGVLGTLTGIIGSIQANEAIKIVTGAGTLLIGQMLLMDIQTYSSTLIQIPKLGKTENAITELMDDYDAFCGTQKNKHIQHNMKEISIQEYQNLLDSREDFQLIDVREPHEFDEFNLGGELIPMQTIPENINQISRDKKVVVHCRAGSRSAQVINYLEKSHGFTNLYNLAGGILAWQKQ
jgi:molybdopterin/thiamine biosynthesis adenylyltransferase/rhodanese-related sulfurtransferase